MKITIETPGEGEEDEIIVRCASLDDRLLGLISALKAEQNQLAGYIEDRIVKLSPKDIYYFESVDNKVFAYAGKSVYEVRKKLYEIEEEYAHTDFLRISKSAIVNVAKIAYIRPLLNGRFEARLKNDEKIIISRQYVIELKKKLGI
ncbi:MAG: LytTR family transcriptional regulator DNA-binding domain-containing protein [Lachnospiraceae bacterium]|nr:LytTR family transcriptional regulator DNA-binding domain-containing protein [Lachnospiraceae bacterium]